MDFLWSPWRLEYVTGNKPDTGCVFCDAPRPPNPDSLIVFERKTCYVILNLYPYNNGHLMVVPNRHIGSLAELDDAALAGALLGACAEAARQAGLVNGYRVVANVGADGGQSVGHLHFHVLGGRAMSWPPG